MLKSVRLVALVCLYFDLSVSEYLVCKTVDEVFDQVQLINQSNIQQGPRGPVGKPGKMGPQGPPGPPGPASPHSAVNWTKIEMRIQEAIANYTERKVERQDSATAESNTPAPCTGILFEQHCIWLLYTQGSSRKNKRQALLDCEERNGTLLDILSQSMQNQIYNYVKKTWTFETSYVDVWLASVYRNGEVYKSNGEIGFVSWYPGHPMGTHTHLMLEVRNNKSGGVWKVPSTRGGIPLCIRSM